MTALTPVQSLTDYWQWQGHTIRYQQAGDQGPALLLVHGFGGSSDHWRKTLPELGRVCRVYAIDLIGFGLSDKPQPGVGIQYTFETWATQLNDFCRDVIQTPAYLVGNSIGCIAALQATVQDPSQVQGVIILNCSLRMLQERKRHLVPWHQRLSTPVIQSLLGNRVVGHFFFRQLAQAKVLRNILREAYGHKPAVTDELIELLLRPAQDPGAADVFLSFVRYSQGPLAEDLLPQVTCPVWIGWGVEDPWEPIELGRQLAEFPAVKAFIPIEGAGHCPQDELPESVNTLIWDCMLEDSLVEHPSSAIS